MHHATDDRARPAEAAVAETMLAVQYSRHGTPEVLGLATVRVPEVRAGSALVAVQASSVNHADLLIRSGKLKLISGRRFPRGTGFDFTGRIAAVGADVDGFSVGDEVWGFLNGTRQGPTAATAEYVVAPVDRLALRPRSLDAVTAAALPGAAGAALAAIETAGVQTGDRVLIRGGAGGVGSAAIQLAAATGAHVTTLVRHAHLARARELGAAVEGELGTFDVILDLVGKRMRAYRRLLAPGGRMLTMTVGGVADGAYLVASHVFGPRRIRLAQLPPDRAALERLAARVDAHDIVPIIDRVFPMADIAEAHRAAEAGGVLGKQVIRVR
ncbi:MAG TPA: NAD(P)-dependent alcohol dehydrogenase [Solirubrobacter sp.]